MAKTQFKTNPRVAPIFNDLEKYLDFCKEFGYKFDEAELYSNKSHTYRQYNKFVAGKPVRNNWVEDSKTDA